VLNREGLIYTVRHRHYEPMLGRFMEQDFLGHIDGMNVYQYVVGDPLGRGGTEIEPSCGAPKY